MKINILDCTLRDGGYINNWGFSKSQLYRINNSLEKSKIDIVELGYLDDKKGREDNVQGAHTRGQNGNSLGICYIGGVEEDGKTPKDTRTCEQEESLESLLRKEDQ